MIINIKNDSGEITYDTNKIKDEAKAREAAIIVSKTGTLEVIIEALSFTSQTHRSNLEKLLNDSPESQIVEEPIESETKTIETKE